MIPGIDDHQNKGFLDESGSFWELFKMNISLNLSRLKEGIFKDITFIATRGKQQLQNMNFF